MTALSMDFIVAFLICLLGYSVHTVGHVLEHQRENPVAQSPGLRKTITIVVLAGWIGWIAMLARDPVRIGWSNTVTVSIGAILSGVGVALIGLAIATKKGVKEETHLVTSGIYAKVRHPMYVGAMLLHLGVPLLTKSLLTLVSAVVWIPFIVSWMALDERGLERYFGQAYLDYKQRTWC